MRLMSVIRKWKDAVTLEEKWREDSRKSRPRFAKSYVGSTVKIRNKLFQSRRLFLLRFALSLCCFVCRRTFVICISKGAR